MVRTVWKYIYGLMIEYELIVVVLDGALVNNSIFSSHNIHFLLSIVCTNILR